MVQLNLPSFEYVLKQEEGKVLILDIIRKKYLMLTPEEWVRQHFLNYLIQNLRYPRSLIKVEGGLQFNKLQKRSDIVVFNRQGNPWMVIECKAPDLTLSQNTIRQASVYNHTLRAQYVVITNGLQHICCVTDWTNNTTQVLAEMPAYE
ncbi:type I restriction enzyme HsdR N-terminal domain-containing protein [Chryseolinea lacunae]|uniref:Type I restriction enzyme HsdR N-terminal domain-containing protein n=1 Tax=Chryseolinea lacunae TaxID=2801331 RepID=A0ABS1KJH8_9BACT|nr:type I restriction enzyme HsdR N-terminal domain-containing protein [Chryseolinea lacunae]MBL0739614.1 type I restriction enzyme HsdR N-terminal domain-containing protein [Chryseolinea lacunae]